MQEAVLLLFALTLSAASSPQESPEKAPRPHTLLPGDASLRPAAVAAHEASYVLYRGEGKTRVPMQRIRRKLAPLVRDGRREIHLSWHTQVGGRSVVDELYLDARTLAPRERVLPLPSGGTARLKIEGRRVHGNLAPEGAPPEEVDARFETQLHDPSLPLLLSLPRKVGARYRLPTLPLELESGRATPAWQIVEIGADTTIEIAPGIELEGWIVTLEPEKDGPTTKWWLAEEEPYVLRKEIEMPGFGTITWELTEDD